MTINPLRLTVFLLLVGLLAWIAWDYRGDQLTTARSERDSAQNEAAGLREAARISGERLATAAANDTKNTQELADALKTNQALRDSVGDRHQRLQVNATCTAIERTDSESAGVADAGSPELTADARQAYFTLRDQLAVSRQMILGLQDHVRSFCTTQPTTTGTAP
ncbi:lysis system i-spanin subunit Rz [Pseudomonas putida]|uniref:lysis system i-spanin subunit Rz n=1 Tax=Pseudomonas putida TaxID=303 RepID=UPI002B24ED8D|nr:lysis system i-spanin subunit Rz [Pseudomonas putida]